MSDAESVVDSVLVMMVSYSTHDETSSVSAVDSAASACRILRCGRRGCASGPYDIGVLYVLSISCSAAAWDVPSFWDGAPSASTAVAALFSNHFRTAFGFVYERVQAARFQTLFGMLMCRVQQCVFTQSLCSM